MRFVIVLLGFIATVLLHPIDCMFARFKGKIMEHIRNTSHAKHPILSAQYFLGLVRAHGEDNIQFFQLDPGLVDAVVLKEDDVEYVIGINKPLDDEPHLFALIEKSEVIHGNLGKIKIRVDGKIAYRYIPISEDNPLNNAFGKPYLGGNLRTFKVEERPTHSLQRIKEVRPIQRPSLAPGSSASGPTLSDPVKYIDEDRQRYSTARANQPIGPENDDKLP